MRQRSITALVFAIIMLASFFLGSIVFSLFYLAVALLCLNEFYNNIKSAGISVARPICIAAAAIMYVVLAATAYKHVSLKYHLLAVAAFSFIPIGELFLHKSRPFVNIAFGYLGIIYTVLPFCFFHFMGFLQSSIIFTTIAPSGQYPDISRFNYFLPLAFLLMLWANDTGAYLSGRAFGKHLLFERHSPKKTWEGFFGGVALSLLAGVLLSLINPALPLAALMGMALIISCFGTLGDLVESMLKRSLKIKDSGNLLPGHGGVLDRFDGLLLSAPLAYVYLYLILK